MGLRQALSHPTKAMPDDPFLTLVVEALNLMHPRFAAAGGADPRPVVREFYHQFRRLWDKALPVRLGLGHVVIQADPAPPPGDAPDLLFWKLGEAGRPDAPLAAVSFFLPPTPADLTPLADYHAAGYPYAVAVAVAPAADALPRADGVTTVWYDTARRTATVLPPHGTV